MTPDIARQEGLDSSNTHVAVPPVRDAGMVFRVFRRSHGTATMNRDADRLLALLKGDADGLRALSEAEWDGLIEHARRSQVSQTLFTYVQALGLSPPPRAAATIRRIHLSSASRSLRSFHELATILETLQNSGVTAIPLKGAWLAEAVYRHIALRGMCDVDLLIERSQLDEARRLLSDIGYESRERTDRPQALQDALGGETKMFRCGQSMLELHWNAFPGEWLRHTANIDERDIWRRSLPHRGEGIRQLAPEDAIIQVCAHLAVNHQMSGPGLRTLLDLDVMRKTLAIDWDTVAARARTWRVATATWLVLGLLCELFGDSERKLPLRQLRPSRLRGRILKCFVTPRKLLEGLRLSRGPARYAFLLALVDRPVDALYLIWRAIVPDRAWLESRYGLGGAPKWRLWLQRLLHPVRVALQKRP